MGATAFVETERTTGWVAMHFTLVFIVTMNRLWSARIEDTSFFRSSSQICRRKSWEVSTFTLPYPADVLLHHHPWLHLHCPFIPIITAMGTKGDNSHLFPILHHGQPNLFDWVDISNTPCMNPFKLDLLSKSCNTKSVLGTIHSLGLCIHMRPKARAAQALMLPQCQKVAQQCGAITSRNAAGTVMPSLTAHLQGPWGPQRMAATQASGYGSP